LELKPAESGKFTGSVRPLLEAESRRLYLCGAFNVKPFGRSAPRNPKAQTEWAENERAKKNAARLELRQVHTKGGGWRRHWLEECYKPCKKNLSNITHTVQIMAIGIVQRKNFRSRSPQMFLYADKLFL
jgi:hypothetical protein